MTTEQQTSNQWNTPWRVQGLDVYNANGKLVAYTGLMQPTSDEQPERTAAMIVEAVNSYSAHEPGERHERRMVGHVGGWQEQMDTCVCGQPWPCPKAQSSKEVVESHLTRPTQAVTNSGLVLCEGVGCYQLSDQQGNVIEVKLRDLGDLHRWFGEILDRRPEKDLLL